MASDKPKQGDKLPHPGSTQQRNEELGVLSLTNSPADLTGTFDDPLLPFPSIRTENLQGMPQHYAQGNSLPLPTIHMMNDFSQFNFPDHTAFDHDHLYGSVPDIPLSEGNVNESVDELPLRALTDVTSKMDDDLENAKIDRKVESSRSEARGSEMFREAAEANIDMHRSSQIGNQMSHGASTPMATHNSTKGKEGINVKTGAACSTHLQILDGSSLKLGIGSNAEPRSTTNISSRYSAFKYNKDALKDETSSSSSCSKMTGDFSTIRNNAGEFNNIAWNDSGFSNLRQNADRLSRVVRNAGGASQQVQNIVEFSNMLQNVGGFSSKMASLGGSSPQIQNSVGFSSQLQNVEQLPRPSPNEGRGTLALEGRQNHHSIPSNWSSKIGVNNTGFQGFPIEPSIPHNKNQVCIPDYEHGANRLQSSFIKNATPSASDQRQNPHSRSFMNLSQEPSQVAPFAGITRSNSGQGQSAKLSQSHDTVPVQLSKSSSKSASNTGQVIPTVNEPAQASSIPWRSFRKRGATKSPLATFEDLHKKVRVSRASSHLSTPNMIAPPQAPSPHAWTPSLRPPSFQPPQNVAQINVSHPALLRIPHLIPPPVQTAHRHLAQSVPNVTQITPPPSPLAWIPPNPALVQMALPRLPQFALNPTQAPPPRAPPAWIPSNPSLVQMALPGRPQFALDLTQAPPPHVPVAGIPLSSPSLIRTVRQRLAQKPPIRSPMIKNVQPPRSQNAPRVQPLPFTKSPDHIKWQDPEKTRQLSGHQCCICKRDLSFTPEGPVEQPVNPPSVAVLPCHHLFHAFCLERITANSDAENPPCIPCALGEKT